MKRKGFTLVELLAVIILLGIIGVIITPNILRLQKKAAKDSFEASVNALIRSAQMYYANNDFINYPSSGIAANSKQLKVKNNETFTGGSIKLVENEYFYAEGVTDGDFCGVGVKNDLTITEGACPQTPDRCFDFDEKTGTITKFNRSKTGCDISNPTIPSRINDITVKRIGFAAFTNYKEIKCLEGDEVNGYIEVDKTGTNYVPKNNEICLIKPDHTKYQPLISVILPDTIEYIDSNAFNGNNIAMIDFTQLPKLKEIGAGAFTDNDLLVTNFINSKDLTLIGAYAFINNEINTAKFSGLNFLTEIGKSAFESNLIDNLTLESLANLNTLGGGAFSTNNLKTVIIKDLPKINKINDSLISNNIIDNVIIENLPEVTTLKPFGNTMKSLTIRNLPKIKVFDDYLFRNNGINSMTIDSLVSLERIGKWSLASNGMKSIEFKNLPALKLIDQYAFHGDYIAGVLDLTGLPNLEKLAYQSFYCNSDITEIKFNNPKLTTIENYAFQSSYKLTKMNIEDTGLITIGVAFKENKLQSLVLPSTLTTITNGGFTQSTPSFTSITVLGTNPKRFNTTWTYIGFPLALRPA